MNFNNDSLHIKRQAKGLSFFVTNTSISSPSGELLFYTNGCSINNAAHELMENGDNLSPGIAYLGGHCPDSGYPATKGAMILPLPGDNTKYYLFHASLVSGQSGGPFSLYVGKLYYSLIDMSLNNGLGAVVEKNQLIIEDTITSELHAAKHANGEDWWIVVMRGHENKYYKLLFTESGITAITEQKIGIDPDPWFTSGGQAGFSPDGTQYARYTKGDQVFLMDFDRETGDLSNFRYLYADTTVGFWGSLAFSPNSRYLYVSTQIKLWQFDTEAPDVQESKILIDEYDGYLHLGHFKTTFYLMQLAPDCKIYMTPRSSGTALHVIHNPDEPGAACNFKQNDLKLLAVHSSTIPNFPNYRLGTPYPVCDSTIQLVTGSVAVLPPAGEVRVWPNPASGEVTVSLPAGLRGEGAWSLHDLTGRQVRRAVLPAGQAVHAVSVEGVPPGLYIWAVQAGGQRLGSGKLVVAPR